MEYASLLKEHSYPVAAVWNMIMPRPLKVYTTGFLNHDEVRLGQLIVNIKDPFAESCPITIHLVHDVDYKIRRYRNTSDQWENSSDYGFFAKLGNFFGSSFKSRRREEGNIQAEIRNTYVLGTHGTVLEALERNKDVMKWVLSRRKGLEVYLVVRLETVTDAGVGLSGEGSTEASISAILPIGAAVGVPGLDVRVESHAASYRGQAAAFVAPGERIVGLSYYRLRVKEERTGDVNEPVKMKLVMGKKGRTEFIGRAR